MKKLPTLFFILAAKIIIAQNFNYTLTKDSTGYAALSSPAVLGSAGTDWSGHQPFTVHLPFHFPLGGTATTDSITVETNGYIVLDKGQNKAVVAFMGFGCAKNEQGSFVSQLASGTSTGSGGRAVIIEFKDVAQNRVSGTDNLSYQTWIMESGAIELHIGSNPYTAIAADSLSGNSKTPALMGIINRNMDTNDKAFLITGSPFSPVGQVISSDPTLLYLENIPSSGDVYILTP